MSMDIYIPGENDIIHETAVDLKGRKIEKTIHLVQYDKNLSVISVKLMSNGDPYTLPLEYDIWLRWGKKDHTYVRKKCMISQDRKTIYFTVDYQMTYFYGDINPILEIIASNTNGSAGTSAIPISIDKNPIQEGDRESETEDPIWDQIEQEIIELRVYVEQTFDSLQEDISNETERAISVESDLSDRVEVLENEGFINRSVNIIDNYIEYTKNRNKNSISTNRTWNTYDVPAIYSLNKSCYGNNGYLLCSTENDSSYGNVKYSPDGSIWYNVSYFADIHYIKDCVYFSGMYYVLAKTGNTFTLYSRSVPYETENDEWNSIELEDISDSSDIKMKAVNNLLFILNGNKVLYSSNAKKFIILFNTGNAKNDVIYANGKYIFTSKNGILYQVNPNDFSEWTFKPIYNNSDLEISSIYLYNNKLIVSQTFSSTYSLIKYTEDLINFNVWNDGIINGFYNGIIQFSSGEGLLYGITNNAIIFSSDGIEYRSDFNIDTKVFYSIIYGDDLFISTSTEGFVYYLDLGITWSKIKPELQDGEFLWIRNCSIDNVGTVHKTNGYLNFIPNKISIFENDSGYVDKSVNNLDNYYDIPTADDLYEEKVDKSENIQNQSIDELF